jgi:hypothetical protein
MSKFKINPIRSYAVPISEPNEIFNTADINSGVETITTGSVNLALENYLPLSGGTLVGSLGISQGNSLFIGTEQQSSFTDQKDSILTSVNNKTTNISYSNGTTTIAENMTVNGNVNLNTRLPVTMIGDGSVTNTHLSYINSLSSNAQTQINGTMNDILSNRLDIDMSIADISSLKVFQSNQETYNEVNDTDISSLKLFQLDQEAYNEVNDTDISSLKLFQLDQETYNGINDTDISLLKVFQSEQLSYNGTNDTDISLLKVFQSEQLSYNGTNDTDISLLKVFKSDQETYNTNATSTLNSLQSQINGNDNELSVLTNNVLMNTNDISLNRSDILINQEDISTNQFDISLNKLSITALESFQTTQYLYNNKNDISLNELKTDHDNIMVDISALNTLVATKQNIVNSSNRLIASYIGDGNVTNTELATLQSINTGTTIQSQINTINTFISDVSGTIGSFATIQDNFDALNTTVSGKANLNGAVFTNYIQTPRIFEAISNSYTSFSSNVLTYDYGYGAILYFAGLTSATNFQLVINNINPLGSTYKSFTFTLIINVATYKAFVSTFKLASTTYTLICAGGLSNVSLTNLTTSGSILQTFTIIFTSSATVPYKVFTSVSQFY